jgi:hypothetical protein
MSRGSQEVFNDIKKFLSGIKKHGGDIDQYDPPLFNLFIEAYKDSHMDLRSSPRLTADEIMALLAADQSYSSMQSNTKYDLHTCFSQKWQGWSEAFEKGFQGNYIKWKNS